MSQEFIACSANHHKDGKVYEHQPFNVESGIVVCGLRHNNCFMSTYQMQDVPLHPHVGGFVTNKNRFVDRIEGLAIATAAGQIIKKHGNNKELYSEDIFL